MMARACYRGRVLSDSAQLTGRGEVVAREPPSTRVQLRQRYSSHSAKNPKPTTYYRILGFGSPHGKDSEYGESARGGHPIAMTITVTSTFDSNTNTYVTTSKPGAIGTPNLWGGYKWISPGWPGQRRSRDKCITATRGGCMGTWLMRRESPEFVTNLH